MKQHNDSCEYKIKFIIAQDPENDNTIHYFQMIKTNYVDMGIST